MVSGMQVRMAQRCSVASLLVLAGCGLLGACSSMGDNPATLFVDPGKYQYSSCQTITNTRKQYSAREQELRELMEAAERNTGGALVNVLAYKADYVAANEELKVLELAARAKNCDQPPNWQSNAVVR
jgi:hypothetical protein